MPFTFSHPAIVPDFEFFLQMKLDENTGHHLNGFILFDLPVALVLCFVFHNLIRNSFISYLPAWYRRRFNSAINFNWNSYAANNKTRLLIATSIGIGSHLLWDGFTHDDGFFVLLIPALQKSISFFQVNIPVYSMLQLGCSVWGLWAVQKFIAAIPVETGTLAKTEKNYIYWSWLTIISIAIFTCRLFTMNGSFKSMDLVFAGIGSMLYAWIAISIGYFKLKKVK
jgi:Domain of unknown function (DUF4184)